MGLIATATGGIRGSGVGGPGDRRPGDDLAPVFRLLIDGKAPLDTDITDFIQSVEFESAIDMSDLLTIIINNPSDIAPGAAGSPPDWTLHKALQPGQEVELHGGYGRAETFIGRAILTKHLPNFPQDGMPTLTVKGYDQSYLMMNASGPLSLSESRVTLQNPRPLNSKDDQGVRFENITPANAVAQCIGKYGFLADIDNLANDGSIFKPINFLQRKGVSDFEICRMLANLHRKEMWVDWDSNAAKLGARDGGRLNGWTFHWRKARDQDVPQYIFQYGEGDESSLLSYSCQYGLKDTITSAIFMVWDPAGQRWISAVDIEDVSGPSPKWKPGAGNQQRIKETKAQVGLDGYTTKNKGIARHKAKENRRAIAGNPAMMNAFLKGTEFRLAAGGTAIDIRTDVPFASLEDAANFALRWIKGNQDNFLIASGTIIGVETLRAGQVHALDGIGDRLSGDYYFISVKHKFTPDKGYVCDFTARMVIE